MTAVAVPPLSLRPVRWTRLGWVAWRRYRFSLFAVLGVLGVLSVYLVIDGNRMRSAWASYAGCHPARSARCQFAWQNFHDSYGDPGLLGVILLFLPGLVGAFAGAPVLARDLETGTFRYAWTQGAGRMRWAVAAVLPGLIGSAALLAAFGTLVSWHDQPLVDADITPRLHATVFPATGLAIAGWTMAGFGLGLLAGALWRRVVPALATAFAAWFGLAFLTADGLRPHYAALRTRTGLNDPAHALVVDRWWTKGGVRVSDAEINSALSAVGIQSRIGSGKVAVHPGVVNVDPMQYLLAHGYQSVSGYQPDSRYWPFQWLEFGWLAALTAVLVGATLWLLRRWSS